MPWIDDGYTKECCFKCGVFFWIPTTLYKTLRREGPNQTFWCPNGHAQVYTGSIETKLRRERDLLAQRIAAKDDKIKALGNQVRAEKAAKTRIKNRISKGVCPCCNRSFTNLGRHMKSKHPDYAEERVDG